MKAFNNVLNRMAGGLAGWVYPAARPSLLPFVVRRSISNAALRCLVTAYKLGGWLDRGIGGVAPDVAKRNGIKE